MPLIVKRFSHTIKFIDVKLRYHALNKRTSKTLQYLLVRVVSRLDCIQRRPHQLWLFQTNIINAREKLIFMINLFKTTNSHPLRLRLLTGFKTIFRLWLSAKNMSIDWEGKRVLQTQFWTLFYDIQSLHFTQMCSKRTLQI